MTALGKFFCAESLLFAREYGNIIRQYRVILRFIMYALEGTRIPGPLIKSQMLYRLSYERIHYKAQYNTILPNNITIFPDKMQAFCTKNFPKAVIGQSLP